MSLLTLIVTLVVVGLIMWLINTYIPLEPKIKTLLNVVVIIFLILWLVQALGLLAPLSRIQVR